MAERRVWAVLCDPADGVSEDDFAARYRELHEQVSALSPSTRVRLLRMTTEQLLPNRAAGAHHGYLALYEGPTADFPHTDTAAGVTVPGVDAADDDPVWSWVDRSDLCVFTGDLIFDTVQPTRLPEGVPDYVYDGPTGGAPGIFWALSNPTSADVEDRYNDWYDTIHTPDTLMQPGMVRGTRYRRATDVPVVGTDYTEQGYLARYEIDDTAKIPGARDAVEWMASVSVDFRSVHFDGNAVRGFTFATVSEFGPTPGLPVEPAREPAAGPQHSAATN